MKKYLKYAGICSLVLAAVGFILMMFTDAVIVGSGNFQIVYSGQNVIFGQSGKLISIKPAPLALIGWILAIVGLAIVLCGIILPLLKVKAFTRFAGLLNLVAVICFAIAGVFMFIVVPSFFAANGSEVPGNASIGAGWVIGGILFIASGVVAILPAAMDFTSKK